MKKKYLMTMLAVAVSAGMMFTGCGNKSDEVSVDLQSIQETQVEVVDSTETSTETTEPTTEAVVSIPYGEENNWEFCEDLELELPYIVVFTDENGDATELPGMSIEKISNVHKFTNVEEIDSDIDGMKKILVDYVAEVNYDIILNDKEYDPSKNMSVAFRVSAFEVCDYYSGMSSSFELEVGDNGESTATGQWSWEWNGQVYPISYECNTVSNIQYNGEPWEKCGDNLYATNSTAVVEASIVIEAPKEYDGLVLLIPKEGVQEYNKLGNMVTEMRDAMLDEDGNLRTKDELYMYRISDTQKKFKDQNLTDADNTDSSDEADYLSANGIEIKKTAFEDDYAQFIHGGLTTAKYVYFDVAETQTVVTIYTSTGQGEENNFETIVNFYDRYTGNNILKESDIYGMYDEEIKTLEAKDGYKVERKGCEYSTHDSSFWFNDYVSTTYTITHPANYDGLVVSLSEAEYCDGSADSTITAKDLDAAFTSEDYTIMDKHKLYGFEYDILAQTEDGKWEHTGEKEVKYNYPLYFTATGN